MLIVSEMKYPDVSDSAEQIFLRDLNSGERFRGRCGFQFECWSIDPSHSQILDL